MPRTIFLYVLLMTLLITGCGPASMPGPLNTPTTEPSASGGDWTIKMTQSGGIMGLSRSIEVSSDGNYTVVDERTNKTVTGELTANELSELNEIGHDFHLYPCNQTRWHRVALIVLCTIWKYKLMERSCLFN